MNISGFFMVWLMRSLQTNKSNTASKFRKAQQDWMKFMPRKLLLSLTLTPLTDRFLFAIMAVDMPKPKIHVVGADDDDIYGFANEESGMWGEEGASLTL